MSNLPPTLASLSDKVIESSVGWIDTFSLAKIGPVSTPGSITIMVTPVLSSPLRMAAWIGDAPLQRGRYEACTLMQPKRGRSRMFWRRILPYAATTMKSGCQFWSCSITSGDFSFSGWIIGSDSSSAFRFTGGEVNRLPRPAGLSAWVITPATGYCLASSSRMETEKSEVPMNTVRYIIRIF